MVLLIKAIDEVIESRAELRSEVELFVEFSADRYIILFLEVEFYVHVEFQQFFHLDFIAGGGFVDSEIFDSEVDIWEVVVVSFVEVAELDPLIDEAQRDVLVFYFVGFEFIEVEGPPGFVHHFSVCLSAADYDIYDHEDYEGDVEGVAKGETCPAPSIEGIYSAFDGVGIVDLNFIDEDPLGQDGAEEAQKEKFEDESGYVSPF